MSEMDKTRVTPVILCGGSGTRLWPRSRHHRPKPFLPLVGNSTLLQQTLARFEGSDVAEAIIVTGAAHVSLVETQLPQPSLGQIIVEPRPMQTAAAVALAAHQLPPDQIMLVCPSDHFISDVEAFEAAWLNAAAIADEGWLVSLAIRATDANTGFGYIRRGELLGTGFRVAEFVEKPEKAKAEQYVASGEFAWNGGIFAFKAKDYLAELARHRPALAAAVRGSIEKGRPSGRHFLPDADKFATIAPESVDYAVMENTDRAAMVMVDMGWSDVGTWDAVRELRARDTRGNTVTGQAKLIDCDGVLIDSDGPTVHAAGLQDIIIVVDGSDILVTTASAAASAGKFA